MEASLKAAASDFKATGGRSFTAADSGAEAEADIPVQILPTSISAEKFSDTFSFLGTDVMIF
jgi:hypothetical protein